MSKIHPTKSDRCGGVRESSAPTVWTVWKKSSMAFQGTDGFSVYDANGSLVFRVDNYSRRSKYFSGDIVLMDGDGKSLLILKPKFFSMHDRWNGFSGENSSTGANPSTHLFSMRRRSPFRINSEMEVFMGSTAAINNTSSPPSTMGPDFRCEGCFTKRSCKIWSGTGEIAAVITPKKVNSVALGDDVFSLIVNPGLNSELIMAFVVVMDRICY